MKINEIPGKKAEEKRWNLRRLFWTVFYAGTIGIFAGFPALASDTLYVNCDVVRGRSSAEIRDDNIVTRFYKGEELKKLETKGDWMKIQSGETVCYVASQYLSQQKNEENVNASKNYELVSLSSSWKYAEYSKINSGQARLYSSTAANKKNKTICVNAGHGTSGGSSVKTLCHPDGSAKVTGGTTGSGAVSAVAVSAGTTFLDGTPEARVTLQMAKLLKERLLQEGYDVLMIRENEDVQLDNIARTVLANQKADCHIALHWDSTSNDKGVFYMSVPSNEAYRAMEPVASNWQSHNRLGEALLTGLKKKGVKQFSSGSMEMDLTQTSYSTVPSIDIELGDRASDHSEAVLSKLAEGLTAGVNVFFEQ